jgi:ubiquinone/menaquinone biosynthesis C-methylase UbiE
MYSHFSEIASEYNVLRTTDIEPILYISEKLKDRESIRAADVGCGAGRYDLLLFKHLNDLHLTCIDINEPMLEKAAELLKNNGIKNFKTVKSDANDIPLEDDSMDCIFTFNAIHHFDFVKFVDNAARVTKKSGLVFIYTRLRSQNANNIWGKYFPSFLEKETRLYEQDEMESMVNSTSMVVESAESFRFKRTLSLDQLVDKARGKHYSTFSFYTEDELKSSIEGFRKNIINNFDNTDKVEWFDENFLLVLKHKDSSNSGGQQ